MNIQYITNFSSLSVIFPAEFLRQKSVVEILAKSKIRGRDKGK
jgi:hypothetical protein